MKKKYIYAIVVLVVFGLPLGYWGWYMVHPGKYDGFATCIAESKTTFFGAFWCPHCQQQKALFGKSEKLLPYVECSLPDGKSQTQVCIDNGIKSYPTWQFADGSRVSGPQSLQTLSEKTGCVLPS
ncbi:MAG: hypothetical protein JWN64_411 [Parcubacteria group bacterium]|nr:hypothetical protein [Parcubacteria group bacterium]